MPTLDTTFAALADPTRRAILSRLKEGEATVLELAKPFAMSQPAVSRHLRVLEEAGLISRRIEGSKRPCRLQSEPLEALDQWLKEFKKALSASYDRLDNVLSEMSQESL
ncbi:MAG: ArsR family transcriptional regulator [Chthonomonadaceae bacterium]|nr:ArsR family transcriptional regulator [Chthonomonadaceae bacterium]